MKVSAEDVRLALVAVQAWAAINDWALFRGRIGPSTFRLKIDDLIDRWARAVEPEPPQERYCSTCKHRPIHAKTHSLIKWDKCTACSPLRTNWEPK